MTCYNKLLLTKIKLLPWMNMLNEHGGIPARGCLELMTRCVFNVFGIQCICTVEITSNLQFLCFVTSRELTFKVIEWQRYQILVPLVPLVSASWLGGFGQGSVCPWKNCSLHNHYNIYKHFQHLHRDSARHGLLLLRGVAAGVHFRHACVYLPHLLLHLPQHLQALTHAAGAKTTVSNTNPHSPHQCRNQH